MQHLSALIGMYVTFVLLLVLLNACGGTIVFTIDQAKAQFIDWVQTQELPEETIGQYLGEVAAEDIIGSEEPGTLPDASGPRASEPLAEGGWLFYADGCPGAFYNHPGKIHVIGTSGQTLYSVDTQGWPMVNGAIPESMNRTFAEMLADVSMTINNPKGIFVPIQGIIMPNVKFRARQFGAVVVNGTIPTQSMYTGISNAHDMFVDAMEDLFNTGTTNYVRSVDYPDNGPTKVVEAVDDLVENEGITDIVLYFIAHGNFERLNLSGEHYYPLDLNSLLDKH
jgi:hypothetical protein